MHCTGTIIKPCRFIVAIFILFFTLLFVEGKGSDFAGLQDYFVQKISFPDIGKYKPVVKYTQAGSDILHVKITWYLNEDVGQNDVEIQLCPAFQPTFHWSPHLTPQQGYIIAQHVFRAPALIASDKEKEIILIPDLDILQKNSSSDWYMDMNAPANIFSLGMSRSKIKEHVLFQKEKGAVYKKGALAFGFYILKNKPKANVVANPWRKALSFMWHKWGMPLYQKGEPLPGNNLEKYVEQTYNWAFKNWRRSVWQEFELNGQKVGAPVFIVNVTQSPGYLGEVNEREFRSIWNQAWFNSLRSASGLYRFARRVHNKTYEKYALMTKELALAFPQHNGFFPSVIATEMQETDIGGKKYNRSKGWDTKYFANSNRNPYTWDPRQSPYHVPDMSYTAYLMLCWYDELEKDERLLAYAKNYADALLNIQQPDGFFPGWLSLHDFRPMAHLNDSPGSSMSATFLLKLFHLTNDKKYFASAEKVLNAVLTEAVPAGRWEDFETYWSCSRYGSDTLVGKKVVRNNMYKQNTLSMYWTAQALLEMYKISRNEKHLQYGQRTLDEMLMAQAVWQPPFIPVRALGGFGVMNADAEWNDSRQSLFAGLILEYGKILNMPEYTQRGMAALKASFTMMYTPMNPQTFRQWNHKWNFFGKDDYGFMMENYGHDGSTSKEGLGIGEFTIYDWGNGAAAEAYSRFLDASK